MCERDRVESFQHIFLRPRCEKKNCNVTHFVPLSCSESHVLINFLKMWAGDKYVDSFEMMKCRYWDAGPAEIWRCVVYTIHHQYASTDILQNFQHCNININEQCSGRISFENA